MILVNNQIDAQFFVYVYFYTLHVSAAMCPSSGELLYQCDTWLMPFCVDDCLVFTSIWPSGMQEHMLLHTRRSSIQSRIIVSVRHLVYVALCRWLSGMQEHMLLHTRRASAQSRITVSVSHLVYVTLCRWLSGMQEHMPVRYAGEYAPAYQTGIYTEWHKPGVALIQ